MFITRRCKLCGNKLKKDPIFILENVPSGAQYFFIKKRFFKKTTTLKIYQCDFCGLVQLSQKPVSYYKSVITAAGLSEEMRNFRKTQFEKFIIENDLKGKKVLVVGAGKGELVKLLEELKVKAYGIEYDKRNVKLAQSKGLKVQRGFLTKKTKLKEAPFDAFIFINFLEHIPKPKDILVAIKNNLKECGVGIVEVPSFEHILETNRFYDFIPDHVSYFTKDTLKLILEITGFSVKSIERIWKGYDVVAYVQNKSCTTKKLEFEDLNIIKELKESINNYIKTGKKVAIWGASHQALTLISMAKLKNIDYIVDSAPFKQGKIFTVLNIPIVSPKELVKKPVDVIYVIAGGYNREIVKSIKSIEEEYDIKFEIYTVENNIIQKV